MRKTLKTFISQKGSMMVEALAMLGLISMVTPVLYKKAAERTTELQDINSAAQLRTLSKAMDDYIRDEYSTLSTTDLPAAGELGVVEISPDDLVPYLPAGFNAENSKLFGDFKTKILKEVVSTGTGQHVAVTGLVAAPLPSAGSLPSIRSSKIAAMVGANGGVLKSGSIEGVQGSWSLEASDVGLNNATEFPEGSLAVASMYATNASSVVASSGTSSEHVLFRDNSQGDKIFNTMQTTLFMGGQNLADVTKLIASATKLDGSANNDTIEITGSAGGSPNVLVSGVANIGATVQDNLLSLTPNALTYSDASTGNTNSLTIDGTAAKLQASNTAAGGTEEKSTLELRNGVFDVRTSSGAQILSKDQASGSYAAISEYTNSVNMETHDPNLGYASMMVVPIVAGINLANYKGGTGELIMERLGGIDDPGIKTTLSADNAKLELESVDSTAKLTGAEGTTISIDSSGNASIKNAGLDTNPNLEISDDYIYTKGLTDASNSYPYLNLEPGVIELKYQSTAPAGLEIDGNASTAALTSTDSTIAAEPNTASISAGATNPTTMTLDDSSLVATAGSSSPAKLS